jgi:UDP:flavonoid glycosyltransferase YjiC (YdhE family)
MISPTVVFFCMGHDGHFRRLQPLIGTLAAHGMDVVVFTDRRFEADVRAAGAEFVDLFAGRPLSAADDVSRPIGCRYVTFAEHFGEAIVTQARALRPRLVLTDSFAVIGRVVAAALEIPYVNVCAGHNVHPAVYPSLLAEIPGVHISEECHAAALLIGEHYGLEGMSPFSYVPPPSPFLNVCCEPPQYLSEDEREPFEPIAFFGSLSPPTEEAAPSAQAAFPAEAKRRVYVSFGTIVWRFYAREAVAALRSIAAAIARHPGTYALMSLGGAEIDPDIVAGLEGPSVRVLSYVDQWRVLAQADAFVSHHGLNSTHEAVFRRVPMLSHPFFWDQPELARKCQGFDFAVPLSSELRVPPGADQVEEALELLFSDRDRFDAALEIAHDWERDVIAARAAVVDRIAQLV